MKLYRLSIKFDNAEKSLNTEDNGIPVLELGELLVAVSHALKLGDKDNSTLGEIRKGSYEAVIVTKSKAKHDRFISLNDRLYNDPWSLEANEGKYLSAIKNIVGKNQVSATTYTSENGWSRSFDEIVIEESVKHYYELEDIEGVITKIGSNSLRENRSIIRVDGQKHEIKVSREQEQELGKYFKKNRILFTVNFKKDIETNRIESAQLERFSLIEEMTLTEYVDQIHKDSGPLFPDIDDSVAAVRKIRGK